ncbi:MAG: hypothetical protein OXC65_05045 [Thiotrichales bacterium]|nr:hypothetical protein [Thiotrichales bacterium]
MTNVTPSTRELTSCSDAELGESGKALTEDIVKNLDDASLVEIAQGMVRQIKTDPEGEQELGNSTSVSLPQDWTPSSAAALAVLNELEVRTSLPWRIPHLAGLLLMMFDLPDDHPKKIEFEDKLFNELETVPKSNVS